MSNEFKHKDAGAKLTRTEDNAVDRHEADGETANDMIYFNGTSWIRAAPATIRTLLSIIAKTLFDANTILKADSDNTPIALAIAEQRIVGRITDGSITALTATQIRTLLNVEDGSTADQTGAEIVALLEALAEGSRLSHTKLDDVGASDHHAKYTDASAVTAAKTVKLDDFTAPDDNTDLNASTSLHGLLLKLGGGTTNFLRADGTWAEPTGGATVATGSYTGNQTARQITTGFKCSIVLVQTTDGQNGDEVFFLFPASLTNRIYSVSVEDRTADIYLHATDGFSLANTQTANKTASTYYYWAISE